MAFFLLGRSEDGSLSLLSNATFESRQDALAELGLITGDASFDRWSDDVLLIDLDSATPVLLVRPTEASPPVEPTPEPEPEPEATVFAAIADEQAEDATDAAIAGVEQADELEALTEELVDTPAPEPEESEQEPDGTEPSAVEEEVAADEPQPPLGAAQELADSKEDDGMDSLRAAIARTTEHMEAAGIVAPESIGPATQVADEDLLPEEPASAEPEAEETTDESPAEPATWPWATEPVVAPIADVADSEALESDVSFVLDGLEEPAVDSGGSLIASSIDDEALAANRPVILGAYAEPSQSEPSRDLPASEPESGETESESAEAQADLGESDADSDTVSGYEPEPESDGDAELEPDAESPDSVEDSDFIVLDDESPAPEADSGSSPELAETPEVGDLDAIEPPSAVSAQPEAASEAEDVLALSSYVCDDCVYVETCPNKDQRRPEDCGSFQWK